MTVCIAAICSWKGQQMIVGASDRMITAGDVQFEPPQTKVFTFGGGYASHYVAMVAGDTAAQVEICRDTDTELRKYTVTEVGQIAKIYGRHFAGFRHRMAAEEILGPLGLDGESFIKRQREMSPEVVSSLTRRLQDYEIDDETIIAGVDATGAHIYVVCDPGHAACNDDVGFAAIGMGEWHAQSQFMFREYTSQTPFERALFLVYSAKKRAEVAPGVGKRATDMFIIGPGITGYYTALPEAILKELETTYDDTQKQERQVEAKAYGKIEQFIKDWLKQTEERAAQATDQEGVSEGAEESQREDGKEA